MLMDCMQSADLSRHTLVGQFDCLRRTPMGTTFVVSLYARISAVDTFGNFISYCVHISFVHNLVENVFSKMTEFVSLSLSPPLN
jgi:hypothetical protein